MFSKKRALQQLQLSSDRIERKVKKLMATFNEAKQAWVNYAQNLSAENAALRAALTDAQSTAQSNAEALAAFQADDAATDAAQLAAQEQAFADDLQSTLDGLQAPPAEPEPLPDQEPPVEE